jgi:cytochrome c-type biogenesis protein
VCLIIVYSETLDFHALKEGNMQDRQVLYRGLLHTIIFIFGFTIIFVSLGAGAGSISMFLSRHRRLISLVGGGIIIVFAVQIMGIFNIPFLNFERKAVLNSRPRGILGAFIIGITFAAAWTPCIGPILSCILILAATKDTAIKGMLLLVSYSVGLGIPFLFAVAAYGFFLSFSSFIKKHFKTIKLLSGGLLLVIGFVLVFGQFAKISQFITFIPDISLIKADNLSVLVAFAAGLVSFVSPCVLPLIPSYLTFITGISLTDFSEEKNP